MREVKQDFIHIQTDADGNVKTMSQSTSYRYSEEEPFVKMYLKHILIYNDLPPKHAELLIALSEYMTYANGNPPQTVHLTHGLKEIIADKCGITIGSLDNALSKLVKDGMLFRVVSPKSGKTMKGSYQLNPFIIGKGDWKDITKLRMTIEFNADGRKLLVEEKRGKKSESEIEGQLGGLLNE